MKPTQAQWQHLYWRAGFGASWQDLQALQNTTLQSEIQKLIKNAKKEPKALIVVEGSSPSFQDIKLMDKEEKKDLRKEVRQGVRLLNSAWIEEMQISDSPLREKMAFFWHGHFACQHKNVFHAQIQLQTLRKHALGSFRELLHAIAKDPAMISYLNNQQNRKGKPNENFARELMELFTLGRGNYTEQDIKESARAFTGWGFNGDEYFFRRIFHDFDSKTFFGKTGNFNGDEIIDMILAKKETALFITQSIYRFFSNKKIDKQKVSQLASNFYKSDYDIAKLMEEIFTADWFYAPEYIGSQIKSPVQLLIGITKQLDLRFGNEFSALLIQKVLGQVVFNPPNVAGWKGGNAWIDSSTLIFRMRLPEFIIKAAEIGIEDKEDDDANTSFKGKGIRNMSAEINWNPFLMRFREAEIKKIYQETQEYLLQVSPKLDEKRPWDFIKATQTEEQLKEICAWLLAMPEYQLC